MVSDDYFYSQLNTKTIEDNDAISLQGLSNPVHLEKENEQLLSSIKLVNDSILRSDGAIIPDTITFKTSIFTDNAQVRVLKPERGEVWKILLPVARTIAGSISTTPAYELWVRGSLESPNELFRIFYFASTSSAPILTEDSNYWGMFQLGFGQELYAEIGSFSATSIEFGVVAGRIR